MTTDPTNSRPSSFTRGRVVAGVLFALFALFVGVSLHFAANRPQWILLVDNEPDAMLIRIVTTESEIPVYQVHVQGEQFDCISLRLPATIAEQANIPGIKTRFMDRTMGPGRWTVRVGSVNLDFWESWIFVNGKQYDPPADVTIPRSGDSN